MKYYKRLKIYKNHNGNNTFDPVSKRAVSYKWWPYLVEYQGKIFFNNYRYSPTTSQHQSQLLSILDELKINIDFTVYVGDGLSGNWQSMALEYHYRNIFTHEAMLKIRRSLRANTKEYYQKVIKENKQKIKALRKIKGFKFTKKEISDLRKSIFNIEIERDNYLKIMSAERKEKRDALKPIMNEVKPLNTFNQAANLDAVTL